MKMRMRVLTTLILLFTAISINAEGIAYMLPDLGTSGMNTYVEFIAPTDEIGYFGTDGFYFSEVNTAIELIATPRAINDKGLIFGPCVVSWDGRLLSTQIIVPPDFGSNSPDWDALSDKNIFDISIKVNGNFVGTPAQDVFTFYVVRAVDRTITGTLFDDYSANGIKRSPRGAILCNSLEINTTDTISFGTDDCDPNTVGNQAFLPVVLLVKEEILANMSTISVNGGDAIGGGSGHGGHGGPGGAGGGGQWHDLDDGTNGGDGYTGGGKGGTNNVLPNSGGRYKAIGGGTGENGESINGIEPPFQADEVYEAAGGGTGHPFGISGVNCDDGDGSNPPADKGFGGGTGYIQKSHGAGGGYRTNGDAATADAAGKAHGNGYIVPLAGGSGAASANPEGPFFNPNNVGGGGGGGGGAIRIFAKNLRGRLTVTANGGRGGNRDYDGGGGSGGAVEIGLKTMPNQNNIIIEVAGGERIGSGFAGGDGYARRDFPEDITDIMGTYDGLAIDSTTYVMKGTTHAINCYSATANAELYMYIEGSNSWQLLTTPGTAGEWTYDYDVPSSVPYTYVCFALVDRGVGTGGGTLTSYFPSDLLSQAAVNVIQFLDPEPVLECTDSLIFEDICYFESSTIDFDIEIENTGQGMLIIDIPDDCFELGTVGFELDPLTPKNFALNANETRTVKVTYELNATELDAIDWSDIREVFYFNHNDTNQTDPWRVHLGIDSVWISSMPRVGTNDFGLIGVNNTMSMGIIYENQGNTTLVLNTMPTVAAPFQITGVEPPLGTPILPSDSLSLTVLFNPTVIDEFTEYINVEYEELHGCDNLIYSYEVLGEAAAVGVSFPTDTIDFGVLSPCDTLQTSDPITIANISPAEQVKLTDSYIQGPDAAYFSHLPDLGPTNQMDLAPYIVNLNGHSVDFSVFFNPSQVALAGKLSANLVIETDLDPPIDRIVIPIKAEIVPHNVDFNPPQLDFTDIYVGYEEKQTFSVINDGRLDEHISNLTLPAQGDISISTINGDENLAADGDLIEYEVTLLLLDDVPYGGIINIDFDTPCPQNHEYPVNATGLRSSARIDALDYEVIQPCLSDTLVINYMNESSAPYTIIQGSEQIINDTENLFSIISSDLSSVAGVHDTLMPDTNILGATIVVNEAQATDYRGDYTADYQATLYKNGVTMDTTISLTVEIDDGTYIISEKNNVFPNTVEGKTIIDEISIKNTDVWDIEIISITSPMTPEFISNPSTIVGASLREGDSTTFDVEFAPLVPGNYSDTLFLELLIGSCPRFDTIVLSGIGAKARTINLRIPDDMVTSPAMMNYSIPIYLKLNDDEDELDSYDIDTIEISYYPGMFFFTGLESVNGEAIEFESNDYINNRKVIRFAMTDVALKRDESVMANIKGATILGDSISSIVRFEKVVLSDNDEVSEITTSDGKLSLVICQEGGDRLISHTGGALKMTVNPNPATTYVKIVVDIFEQGDYTLSICGLDGIETVIENWSKGNPGIEPKIVDYQITESPNAYFIILQTPSARLTQSIIIIGS